MCEEKLAKFSSNAEYFAFVKIEAGMRVRDTLAWMHKNAAVSVHYRSQYWPIL